MSRKDKEKKSRFQLPQMTVNEPKIEMSGNREIVIDGCKGVVEYGENLIKLNLGERVLTLSGSDLVINSFDSGIAVINGQIGDISFVS
ncbi:MAG: YabP/YqfC family sporulation protein [Clostridia bacterium]|nr:YabP/YqfC family sporulation protein [Clostridia bacterium]